MDAERLTRVLVAAICACALLLCPLVALERGWLPADDACRHSAFATVDRAWSDIIVVRADAGRDQHQLWHGLLRAIHHATDAGPPALLLFSVIALAWLFGLVPLAWARRPEAWVLALGLVTFGEIMFASRWLSGRPLVVSMTALAVILLAWSRESPEPERRAGPWALAVVAFATGAGLHGSWYLLALVPCGFALALRLRAAIALGVAWVAGSVLAALVTGRPVEALVSPLHHLQLTMFSGPPAVFKVGEIMPGNAAWPCVALVALAVAARLKWRPEAPRPWRDPSLMLAALCWALGLLVTRFWIDWGVPALACFLALEIRAHAEARARSAPRRLALAVVAALMLVASVGVDRGGRWSVPVQAAHLDPTDPALAGFVPEPGGILYNERMADFYLGFFDHPEAPWRYELGFEPALLPEDQLAEYRSIQRQQYQLSSFAPWLRRMTPRDRILLHWEYPDPPEIPGMEWRHAGADLWLGRRLHRTVAPAVGKPATAP